MNFRPSWRRPVCCTLQVTQPPKATAPLEEKAVDKPKWRILSKLFGNISRKADQELVTWVYLRHALGQEPAAIELVKLLIEAKRFDDAMAHIRRL